MFALVCKVPHTFHLEVWDCPVFAIRLLNALSNFGTFSSLQLIDVDRMEKDGSTLARVRMCVGLQ